jgi:WD40 repeat protein
MKGKFVFILSLLVLSFSMAYVKSSSVEVKASDSIDTSKIYGVEMLWNNSMSVNDVAVSKDGKYIAAVNGSGLYYFAWDNSTPRWWCWSYGAFISVAISADGEYVVAGDNSGYIYYFNESRATTGERTDPTWMSVDLGGPVERGTVDMSDDGEYTVVGGTGTSLYYFAQCRTRIGNPYGEEPTWTRFIMAWDVLAVDMSPDGKYVAAGGTNSSVGFVIFYSNASGATAPYEPTWDSWSSVGGQILDLAVSDDGYSVVAVDEGPIPLTLRYWANATNLSGDPNATWTRNWAFHCVEMSADGDEVIAGTALYPCGLHFWADARERSGYDQVENWTRHEGETIHDVAMSDNGGIIAASAETAESNYTAYFYKSDGNVIGEFELPQSSPLVSMSGNGNITAIGGPSLDSLYVFRMILDTTPPLIENVHQEPANDAVYPEDDVMVYANVTDDLSGVKQVTLNYTYTNSTGTWHGTVVMDNPEGDLYNGTIPKLPYCTNVTYIIIAEDYFNNTIISEEEGYRYHVIPEFSLQIILPILATTTLLAVLIRKRKFISYARTYDNSKK